MVVGAAQDLLARIAAAEEEARSAKRSAAGGTGDGCNVKRPATSEFDISQKFASKKYFADGGERFQGVSPQTGLAGVRPLQQ